MTKAELNLAIAKLVYPEYAEDMLEVAGFARWEVSIGIGFFDYKDWNDLMPLVVEHGIEMYPVSSDTWSVWGGKTNVKDKDPQRALAECLLKVLQEKADV